MTCSEGDTLRTHTSVRCRARDTIRAVAEPSGDECTDPQHELLQRRHPSSDAWVGYFTLVYWDDHHQEADTQTSNSATSPHPVEGLSSSLEDTTNDEDYCSQEDSPSST